VEANSTPKEILSRMSSEGERSKEQREAELPPERVKAAPSLKDDLLGLTELTTSCTRPRRLVRSGIALQVFCKFGAEALAVGHASNFQGLRRNGEKLEADGRILFWHGHWGDSISEASSKYQELLNLVELLEAQVEDGRIKGAEVFLFTDNSTAEAVFFKENSTLKRLFDFILRLRKVEMEGQLLLHVVHVAGTRMPPTAADVVTEQLREAQHKRPDCLHITVVPRFMTARWRKILAKDLIVELPAGNATCPKRERWSWKEI
jgi:hypothetical protein